MDIIKKNFGNQLKTIRKSQNITQEKLAERIGINLRQLVKIEAGKSFVKSDTLYKLSYVLNVSPSSFFDFSVQEEALKNGTDNTVYLKVIKSGNISQVTNTKVLSKIEDNEIEMGEMAKRINKNIFVDEIKDGVVVLTKIYKPDGTVETKNKNNINEDYEKLKDKLFKISQNKEKIDFMNLAFDSLTDKESLEKLKYLIKGIELTL